jgi:hypothetical protein
MILDSRFRGNDSGDKSGMTGSVKIEPFFFFEIPVQKDSLDTSLRKWYIAIMQYALQ